LLTRFLAAFECIASTAAGYPHAAESGLYQEHAVNRQPVFLLLVHADAEQAKRLVRLLLRVGKCFIHVDAKSSLDDFRVDDSRAVYLDDRVDVHWGAISQVHATLRLMRAAVSACPAGEVSHFVLLSGSCYPAKSLVEFRQFSLDNAATNFIKTIPLSTSVKLYQRIRHAWFYEDFPADGRKISFDRLIRGLLQGLGKMARRRVPPYADWCFGSQWWALNHTAASLLLAYSGEEKITRFLRFSKAPDEIYFHTLIASSCLKATSQRTSGDGVWHANNLHLIDPSLSRWFNAGDFDEIIDSLCWFVRKVNTTRGGDLCDKLDRYTGNAV
jgi:hypothetical protein